MPCAGFSRHYVVKRQTFLRSLNGLQLHFDVLEEVIRITLKCDQIWLWGIPPQRTVCWNIELKAIVDLRPCFPKGSRGKSECYRTAILTRDK